MYKPFRSLAVLALLAAPPALGAATPDELHGCGWPDSVDQKAAHACGQFDVSPLFARSTEIQDVKRSCLAFFRDAAKSVNLLCSYKKDFDAFADQAKAIPSAADAGQADKALAASGAMSGEAADLHAAYRRSIHLKYNDLRKSFQDYLAKIGKLNNNQMARSLLERMCKQGSPILTKDSDVPAVVEKALVNKSFAEGSKTFQGLQKTMVQAMLAFSGSAKNEATNAAALDARSNQLDSLGGAATPEEAPTGPRRAGTQDVVRLGAVVAAREGLVRQLGASALKANAGAVVAGTAVELLVYREVRLPELLSMAAWGFGNVAGLSAAALSAAYRDSQATQAEYDEFARRYVLSHQNARAGEVAEAYAAAKGRKCDWAHRP
jgi:hypothetical protein